MADNQNELDLTEVLSTLTDAIEEDRRLRVLSAKDAGKADKLLISELKQQRKEANRKPAGMASRVGKRALGGIGGAIGGAIGSIPIAGTILKVLGQEFRNARYDKKAHQKLLKQRRKLELKEIDRLSKIQARLDARNADRERDEGGEGEGGGEDAPTTNQAIEKLADAALHLQATAISLTPAIETFHETVAKMSDVVDRMAEQDDGTQRIRDQQVIEYLHAIDYMTQANAATSERNEDQFKSIGSNIGNIKWHMARANGSAGRIEKLMKDGTTIEVKSDADLISDVGKIKWHTARINGSNSRIEKLLMQAADDRMKTLDNQKQDLKLQESQLDTQETDVTVGIIGAITNLFGGTGTAIAALGAMTLGAGAAAAFGLELGKAINDWIPENEISEAIRDGFGKAVDHVLAAFGNDEAKERLNMFKSEENLETAWNSPETADAKKNRPDEYATYNEPWQQDYAKKHGEFAEKDRFVMHDPRTNKWNPANYISEPMYEHERAAKQKEYDEIANQLNKQSAEVEDAKNAPTSTPVASNITAANQTNVTNNTVQSHPLNTRSDRPAGRKNTDGEW